MKKERLYAIHGRGNDAVGLVGGLTGPLGQAGANIVDLRQDVLHGLYVIHLVVDTAGTELRLEQLEQLVRHLAEDTGLSLWVEKFHPAPADLDRRHLLVILLGADRPGIVASVSEILARYRANIEIVQTVGREGMFLMEILTDVSHCRLPLDNLMASVEDTMRGLGMQTRFQAEDVFNKKKRVVLFDVRHSLIEWPTQREIVRQAGLDAAGVTQTYGGSDPLANLQRAGSLLHDLPASVLEAIGAGVRPTRGTIELVQTLKTMGYRVALATCALSGLVEPWAKRLGLDHLFAVPTRIDDDEQTIDGELTAEDYSASSVKRAVAAVASREQVDQRDVTVIADTDAETPMGIRLEFDLAQLLHLRNERVLSADQLLGLLGSFGLVRPAT